MRLINPVAEPHNLCEPFTRDAGTIFRSVQVRNGGCKYARLFVLLQELQELQEMIEPMSVSEDRI